MQQQRGDLNLQGLGLGLGLGSGLGLGLGSCTFILPVRPRARARARTRARAGIGLGSRCRVLYLHLASEALTLDGAAQVASGLRHDHAELRSEGPATRVGGNSALCAAAQGRSCSHCRAVAVAGGTMALWRAAAATRLVLDVAHVDHAHDVGMRAVEQPQDRQLAEHAHVQA
eukprot:scaffold19009_cov55-Phaeocystis_antarctica.AAC.4